MLNLNEKVIDAYREKVNAQIKEMKAKIMVLESKAENSSADMRIKYQKKIGELKPLMKEIENKLKRLSESGEDAWNEMKSGLDESISELQTALSDATEHFNN